MNSKYKMILMESKKLNGSGLLQKASANNITADKILYEYAIQMVSKLFDYRKLEWLRLNWRDYLSFHSVNLLR